MTVTRSCGGGADAQAGEGIARERKARKGRMWVRDRGKLCKEEESGLERAQKILRWPRGARDRTWRESATATKVKRESVKNQD